jgi:hypothetical protein
VRDVCGCSLHVYRLCMRRHHARPGDVATRHHLACAPSRRGVVA